MDVLPILGALLGSALLLRLLPRAAPAEGWRWRVDAPLALACGVTATVLAAFVLYPANFVGVPLDGSDHDQYCEVVGALHDGVLRGAAGGQRSGVAGLLPGWLSHAVGLYDALAIAALVSFAAMVAATYVWARAFGGRVGGVVAALACAGVELVTTLPRNLSFYAEIDAATVLAAAGASWALARGGLGSFAFAGGSIGLLLLMDVRGIVWAAPCLAVAALGAVLPGEGRRVARVGLLVAGLAVSWPLARYAWLPGAPTLEAQTAAWARMAMPSAAVPPPPDVAHGGYRWGASSPIKLPKTARYLLDLRAAPAPVPAAGTPEARSVARVRDILGPMVGFSLGIAALALLRRPRALTALVATATPFGASLAQACAVLPQNRYLTTGLLVAPLALGLAFGALGEAPVRAAAPRPRVEAARVLLAAALIVAAVSGWLPSPLHPSDPGRLRAIDGSGLDEMVGRIRSGTALEREQPCARAATAWDAPFRLGIYGLDLGAGR